MTTDLQPQHDASDESAIAAAPPRTLISSMVGAIRASYNPQPVEAPSIDPQLPTLPAVLRVAEVCRFTLSKLEYSLSSGGGLRAWFKLNLLIALLIAAPAILILPVITLVLGTFATWSEYIYATAVNIFWATVYVAATAAMITAALWVIRAIVARCR